MIVVHMLFFLAAARADVLGDDYARGLAGEPVFDALVAAVNLKYGVHCDPAHATGQTTVSGYYSDFEFFASVPCGKPSKPAQFDELSLKLHAVVPENRPETHIACFELDFGGASFGFQDPLMKCQPPRATASRVAAATQTR